MALHEKSTVSRNSCCHPRTAGTASLRSCGLGQSLLLDLESGLNPLDHQSLDVPPGRFGVLGITSGFMLGGRVLLPPPLRDEVVRRLELPLCRYGVSNRTLLALEVAPRQLRAVICSPIGFRHGLVLAPRLPQLGSKVLSVLAQRLQLAAEATTFNTQGISFVLATAGLVFEPQSLGILEPQSLGCLAENLVFPLERLCLLFARLGISFGHVQLLLERLELRQLMAQLADLRPRAGSLTLPHIQAFLETSTFWALVSDLLQLEGEALAIVAASL